MNKRRCRCHDVNLRCEHRLRPPATRRRAVAEWGTHSRFLAALGRAPGLVPNGQFHDDGQ
jgi:hypothetical protein